MHRLERMKKELAAQYRQAVEDFCDLIIAAKALDASEDEEVRVRIEAAQQRCEQTRIALFGVEA